MYSWNTYMPTTCIARIRWWILDSEQNTSPHRAVQAACLAAANICIARPTQMQFTAMPLGSPLEVELEVKKHHIITSHNDNIDTVLRSEHSHDVMRPSVTVKSTWPRMTIHSWFASSLLTSGSGAFAEFGRLRCPACNPSPGHGGRAGRVPFWFRAHRGQKKRSSKPKIQTKLLLVIEVMLCYSYD